jgi:two-component system NarL family sensor kinase
VIGLLFPLVFLASVGSLFLRFRRARGIERQQIKWVAFGLVFAFVTIIIGDFVLSGSGVLAAIVGGAGFLAFPVSIGIAVLRFRLYDLDVVVRKTVVAGVLAAFVALVYAAIVAAGSLIVGSSDTTLAVIAAVVLALAFQPVRSRARRFADRLVYGERANPYEVLTEFSSRVGGPTRPRTSFLGWRRSSARGLARRARASGCASAGSSVPARRGRPTARPRAASGSMATRCPRSRVSTRFPSGTAASSSEPSRCRCLRTIP